MGRSKGEGTLGRSVARSVKGRQNLAGDAVTDSFVRSAAYQHCSSSSLKVFHRIVPSIQQDILSLRCWFVGWLIKSGLIKKNLHENTALFLLVLYLQMNMDTHFNILLSGWCEMIYFVTLVANRESVPEPFRKISQSKRQALFLEFKRLK